MDDGVDYMHPDLRDNYVSSTRFLYPEPLVGTSRNGYRSTNSHSVWRGSSTITDFYDLVYTPIRNKTLHVKAVVSVDALRSKERFYRTKRRQIMVENRI